MHMCVVCTVADLWVERDQTELCVASQLCAFQNWKIELQSPLPYKLTEQNNLIYYVIVYHVHV